jgi:hypothetical protein
MKKIVLTENQYKNLQKTLKEDVNDRYQRTVSVSVDTYGLKINGNDVDWATCPDMTLSYIIEQEHRSWGIKDISLYNIEGPSDVEIIITPQVEDSEDIEVTVSLDWENMISTALESGEGVVTIGSEIDMKLTNNENGDIVVEYISVPVYAL